MLKAKAIARIQADWAGYEKVFPDVASGLAPETFTNNIVALATYTAAIDWAAYQAEECFCDFVGLWIFGASFLHAFEYLLAPNWGFQRAETYPAMHDRAAHLIAAASRYNVDVDADFAASFKNEPPASLPKYEEYQLRLADLVLRDIVGELAQKARADLEARGIQPPAQERVAQQLRALQRLVPCQSADSLSEIVAAGWCAIRDEQLWSDHPHIGETDAMLRDILLKSVELFEIEQRQRTS